MKTIIAIARQQDWQEAETTGQYTHSTIDSTLKDIGFLHCSFPEQTLEIANRKYADQDNLVLLLVDVDKVKSPVRYEKALSGRTGIFPHIYGPLNVDGVYATIPFEKNAEGVFVLPDQLTEAQGNDDFTKVVKLMAETPPISNEELVKRNREKRS